jgi:hypothetical protein
MHIFLNNSISNKLPVFRPKEKTTTGSCLSERTRSGETSVKKRSPSAAEFKLVDSITTSNSNDKIRQLGRLASQMSPDHYCPTWLANAWTSCKRFERTYRKEYLSSIKSTRRYAATGRHQDLLRQEVVQDRMASCVQTWHRMLRYRLILYIQNRPRRQNETIVRAEKTGSTVKNVNTLMQWSSEHMAVLVPFMKSSNHVGKKLPRCKMQCTNVANKKIPSTNEVMKSHLEEIPRRKERSWADVIGRQSECNRLFAELIYFSSRLLRTVTTLCSTIYCGEEN